MAVLAAVTVSTAAQAHKEHRQQAAEQAQAQAAQSPTGTEAGGHGAAADDPRAGHDGEPKEQMGFVERLFDWLGRTHPLVVHFPIAFFPAALVVAVMGRRKQAYAAPVQFLVVTGGLIAPVAAAFGWLAASGAEPDALLEAHRWLGTGIGITGFALALWAWARPGDDRSLGMIAALTAITAAIFVQGWLGGALVHGADHLSF